MNKLLLIVLVLMISGCAKTSFSSMQSAKLIDNNSFEYSAFVSYFSNFGIRFAYGLNEKNNLNAHIAYIGVTHDSIRYKLNNSFFMNEYSEYDCPGFICTENTEFVELSLGLKHQIIKDRSAFNIPVSFSFNTVTKHNELTTIKPEFLYTIALGEKKRFEFSHSFKLLVPLTQIKDASPVINLGFGIVIEPYQLFINRHKWIIRPELSTLFLPGYRKGIAAQQISLSFSVYP